jgi:cell division protein FtsB
LNFILFLFLFYFILFCFFGGVLVMVVQADDTRPAAQASKTNLHALN